MYCTALWIDLLKCTIWISLPCLSHTNAHTYCAPTRQATLLLVDEPSPFIFSSFLNTFFSYSLEIFLLQHFLLAEWILVFLLLSWDAFSPSCLRCSSSHSLDLGYEAVVGGAVFGASQGPQSLFYLQQWAIPGLHLASHPRCQIVMEMIPFSMEEFTESKLSPWVFIAIFSMTFANGSWSLLVWERWVMKSKHHICIHSKTRQSILSPSEDFALGI